MEALTGSQRRHLRGLAHSLDPVVHIGQHGLGEAVLQEVEKALDHHELIKVRMVGDKGEKKTFAGEIDRRLGCECVGMIGHVAIFYRPHPDEAKRKVRLRA
ncbi:MAG: ribosome assembly RNA-binding protein YhbY [Acidobacteriota bacterium]